jgi:Ni,Fe-hydrogenase III large subunit
MSPLNEILIKGRRAKAQRVWPRVIVTSEIWDRVSKGLAEGHLVLLGLWAEADAVHMAILNEKPFDITVVTFEVTDGTFPSVGAVHPPALRLERTIRDLHGLEPVGLPDQRRWLDHGQWGLNHPLGSRTPVPSGSARYPFLPTEGENLHQIPVGPVHAGIIEPGHFRFTASGETVVRLEQRLGYTHKGIESLMHGADLTRAARLVGRISGDSTVAYAMAFAHAVEAALSITVPPRAAWLRALMAELERLANHFGDFGAICNDASFSIMHAQCGMLRERVLRAAAASFGHRLMMDCAVPGGVIADLTPGGAVEVRSLLKEIGHLFPKLVDLYDNTASLQDRTVTTGILTPALARQYGAGGYVGRASGRSFDARRAIAYPPYDKLEFNIPVLTEGDVNARVWIRIREIEQSLVIVEQILDHLPTGPIRASIAPRKSSGAREGLGVVEGFRGDVFAWLRLDDNGAIARCHLRDPSWFQWPLLEAVIEGNIVADFPLCNKSFNCSYSGHDL